MKNKDRIVQAEHSMLSAQTHYAHKLTQEASIQMLRRQVDDWRLVAESRGEATGAGERSR
jgi:hypothetical protein